MSDIRKWSPDANTGHQITVPPPDGAPEGHSASQVNDIQREVMAAVRRQWQDKEWFDYGDPPTFVSANQFLIADTHADQYTIGRRIRAALGGTADMPTAPYVFGTITSVGAGAGVITVTLAMDGAEELTAGISAVYFGTELKGVPASSRVHIGATPPPNPIVNDLWWHSGVGGMRVLFLDEDATDPVWVHVERFSSAYDDLQQQVNQLPGRNLFINGAFNVWQRGTSFPSISNEYTADRWRDAYGIGDPTISRQTFQTDNYYLRCDFATPGVNQGIMQRIENVSILQQGRDIEQPVVLSGRARAVGGTVLEFSVRQKFGDGGDSEVETVSGEMTVGTSWTDIRASITLPSIAGKTIGANSMLEVRIYDPNGTMTQLDFDELQLEAGTIATPFEVIDPATELTRCQRYFETSYNVGIVPGTAGQNGSALNSQAVRGASITNVYQAFLKVTKRDTPTIVMYSPDTGASGKIRNFSQDTDIDVSVESGSQNFRYNNSSGAQVAENDNLRAHYTADAEL